MTQPQSEPNTYRQHRYAPPPGATEILLVRHGESQPVDPENPFELVDGHGDPPLDPVGGDQAERLAERLGIVPSVEPELREVYLGEWEGGLLRVKAAEHDPAFVRAVEEQRWDLIPGGEPAEVFRDRVALGISRVAVAHPDQLVVVVTHGGVIGEVLANATGARGFAFIGADNASISHIVVEEDRITVRRFNDTTHLDPHFSVAAPPPI